MLEVDGPVHVGEGHELAGGCLDERDEGAEGGDEVGVDDGRVVVHEVDPCRADAERAAERGCECQRNEIIHIKILTQGE